MRAILTAAPGGWKSTSLTEVPEPVAGPGDVLVEIKAIGLNPADYFQIEGSYPGGPRAPFICGRDAAGVVIQGDAVGRWRPGSSVVVLQTEDRSLAEGTFCERQKFPAHSLAPLPTGWSYEEGAAAPLAYQTAWRGLVIQGGLSEGKTVVITGASGGVGSAGVLLAAGLGARVVALSRSPEKQARLKEIGAHFVFSPEDKDLKKKIFAALDTKGVDLVLENVGGPSLGTSVHLLGIKGKVCVVGLLAGVEGSIPIPSLMFKQASVEGVVVSAYSAEESQDSWTQIVETLAKVGRKPILEGSFPMTDYLAAFERLRSAPFGKVVLAT
ncbi:MAG: zinc-binding alcohol dehydrogenase family protein [Planctomycetota bacterium]